MPQVAICIATRCRPDWLRMLLAALVELEFPAGTPQPSIVVVVVDNDPRGSARSVVDDARDYPLRLVYAPEGRPGVSHVRNTAVRLAGDVDYLAFIDDDELPAPGWLAELLRVQESYGADVVTGPVEPTVDGDAPRWLTAARFLDPVVAATGTVRSSAATGNALVRRQVFDELGGFDPTFGLSGGEDLHFFTKAHREGYLIVWAADAAVSERVPRERMTLGWHLRRGFREGAVSARVARLLDPSTTRWASLARASTVALFRGLGGALVLSLIGHRAHAARALRLSFSGLGGLAGLVGFSYSQYGNPLRSPSAHVTTGGG